MAEKLIKPLRWRDLQAPISTFEVEVDCTRALWSMRWRLTVARWLILLATRIVKSNLKWEETYDA